MKLAARGRTTLARESPGPVVLPFKAVLQMLYYVTIERLVHSTAHVTAINVAPVL